MSFAATLALVAGYEAISERAERGSSACRSRRPRRRRAALAVGAEPVPHLADRRPRHDAVRHLPLPARGAADALSPIWRRCRSSALVVMPMAFFAVAADAVRPRIAAADRHGLGPRLGGFVARMHRRPGRRAGAACRCRRSRRCFSSSPAFSGWRSGASAGGSPAFVPIAVALAVVLLAPRPGYPGRREAGRRSRCAAPTARYRIIGGKENRFVVEILAARRRAIRDRLGGAERGRRCDPLGCVTDLADGHRLSP